jgi:hypothetical protein
VAFPTLVVLWLAPAGTKITSPALHTLGLPAVDLDFERPLQQMATGASRRSGWFKSTERKGGDLDQNSASWNRFVSWLQRLEGLQRTG